MILDGVVGPAVKDLGDLGPFVAYSSVIQKEEPLLLFTPLSLLNLRIKVIMPSLPALFSNSTWQMFSNLCPLRGAMCAH